jgi:hypothetical protein
MRIRAFEKVSFLETFVIDLPRRKQEKTVHVISRKPFNDAAQKYPTIGTPWFKYTAPYAVAHSPILMIYGKYFRLWITLNIEINGG